MHKIEKRFWSKVEFIPEHECWEWTGWKTKKGYGEFYIKGKKVGAHRASWMLNLGALPEGLLVCHKCDNPGCIRPDHLFLGTDKDNVQDMLKKGRNRHPKGKNHVSCKITEQIVLAIREESLAFSSRRLAKKYNLCKTHIQSIINKTKWAHI